MRNAGKTEIKNDFKPEVYQIIFQEKQILMPLYLNEFGNTLSPIMKSSKIVILLFTLFLLLPFQRVCAAPSQGTITSVKYVVPKNKSSDDRTNQSKPA